MEQLNKKLLIALLDLAQSDVPASVQSLAEHLGATRREVAEGLSALDQAGLVRAEKIRLTMVGLVRAAGLRERSRKKQRSRLAA